MADLIRIFEVVLPVILLVVFGYFGKRRGFLTDSFLDSGSRLVFTVFLPINMFVNIYHSTGLSSVNINIVIYSVIAQIFILFISYFIFKNMGFDNEEMAVMIQTLLRSNIVLFGLSIAKNYFDRDGVAIVSIYIGLIAAFSNGFAIIIYEVLTKTETNLDIGKILLNVIKNPIFIASILGIAVNFSGIKIYEPIMKAGSDLSSMATPLGLMCVGGTIKFVGDSREKRAVNTTVIAKAIIIPIIMLLISYFMGIKGPEMFVMIILFAAPVAVSSHAMSVIYTSKGDLCAKIIVYTTIFNSVTIFLAIYILSYLGII